MKHLRHLPSLHTNTDGAAIIEATVVIPFLIFLMIGVMDFGLAYSNVAEAQKSLRAASRYLSKLPMSRLCEVNGGQKEAKQLALYGDPSLTTGTTRVANWVPGDITITLTPACATPPSTTPVDTKINMKADVPYQALAWRALGFSGSLTLKTEHEERWIGQ